MSCPERIDIPAYMVVSTPSCIPLLGRLDCLQTTDVYSGISRITKARTPPELNDTGSGRQHCTVIAPMTWDPCLAKALLYDHVHVGSHGDFGFLPNYSNTRASVPKHYLPIFQFRAANPNDVVSYVRAERPEVSGRSLV